MENPQMAKAVRFMSPEKMLNFAPDLGDETIAALFGLDAMAYRAIKADLDARARGAARELLADPSFAGCVDRLPFRPGACVVAVGESSTADLEGWAEILCHLLELRRPHDGIRLVNAGLSGQTTTQALSRFVATAGCRPDWVICSLGGNDCARYGPEPTKTLVGPEETAKNLKEMRRIAAAETGARWVWITPTTADEERVTSFPFFRQAQLSLRNDDLLAVGDFLRARPEPVVDAQAVFGAPADPELMEPDGIHPSLAGQKAIVEALVERLAS
jgi:acyl-CoA thioesterase-1